MERYRKNQKEMRVVKAVREMPEGERWKARCAFFLIVLILMWAEMCFGMWNLRRQTKETVEDMIAIMYQMDPGVSEDAMRIMFETEKGGGEKALAEMGYTVRGVDYLYDQRGIDRGIPVVLFIQIMLACILFRIFLGLKKEQEERQEDLGERIRTAERSRGTESAWNTGDAVESELCRLLERKEGEKEFLQRKLSMVQNFIENTAHQIRTPLNCITLSLDMITEKSTEQSEKQALGPDRAENDAVWQCRQYALQSLEYAERIRSLLSKILDISRLEAGRVVWHKERFYMEELLYECRCSLEGGEKRIRIEVTGTRTEYYGDFDWMKEAFCNIFQNCLEHDMSKEKIAVTVTEGREGVKVAVRDHGPGIDPRDLPCIFDRFYLPEHLKKSHVGIGLNLAKLVIEQHFGTISAANHEDGGAVFTVILPLYAVKTEKI